MKTTYFLSLLITFTCYFSNAQKINFKTTNITISITKVKGDEIVGFEHRDELIFYKDDKIFPKIDVRVQTKLKKTRYFRFGFATQPTTASFPNTECPDSADNFGVTAPVIIPPIGGDGDDDDDDNDKGQHVIKKKTNNFSAFGYPYYIKKELWLPSSLIEYKFYLREYEDKKTYLEDEKGEKGELLICSAMLIRILNIERPDHKEENLMVYPNPFTDILVIKTKQKQVAVPNIRIYEANGREILINMPVKSISNLDNEFIIDTSILTKGIYYYHIKLDKELHIKKLIKQ